MTKRITIVDTATFMRHARAAEGTGRCIDRVKVAGVIDPDGRHLLAGTYPYALPHAERTLWLVKLRASMVPARMWLDVPCKAWQRLSAARVNLGWPTGDGPPEVETLAVADAMLRLP